jgi:hypothetical protein
MNVSSSIVVLGFVASTLSAAAVGEEEAYVLPDPLLQADGAAVATPAAWREGRRGEILELFRSQVYGRSPAPPQQIGFEILEESSQALSGSAIRRQVRIRLGGQLDAPFLDLLLYAPRSETPVPAILGLNFAGNHSIHADPQIRVTSSWVRDDPEHGVTGNRASEASRGSRASRWPVQAILDRGYALATAYYGDIDPDYDDGFRNGVHALGYEEAPAPPAGERWGSIAAWAWGLSRALDYLETDPSVDALRVAVMGHSRLGKTALWAGAEDERFALVISNDSGCGGAALSRRRVGETVKQINDRFPHWFADNFARYDDREPELPVDQHMLLALVAPRPLYVASATGDAWADPRGEFLSCVHASPVYELLGQPGLGTSEPPAPDTPIARGRIGYHIRTGVHDVTAFDWDAFLDFADRHLRR